MKFFPAIILLVSSIIFPQESDSVYADSLKILTNSVKNDTSAYDTTIIKPDTLYPLYQDPFYSESFFISRQAIDLLDYRYSGNLFMPAAFSFLKDKGMIGQPNEIVIYGNGFGGIGFFSDGIPGTNRFTNSLDLNLIQNELIDSIEVLPLPRGFLYGPDNYLTAVNFIEKDFVTPAPYTRIKYYEGPEGEAFIDGIFNSSFLNMFNIFLDISNRNFDGIYDNSDFSIWQAGFKLKYFLSNSINIISSYSFVSSELGDFGGVDVDSISEISNDINSILYDPLQAPVVNPTLRRESKWDKFKLKTIGKFGNINTDLNFYYHAEAEKYSSIPTNDEIKNYIFGISLRQSYSNSIMNFQINGVFENRELNYYSISPASGFQREKSDFNVISFSPVLSIYLLDSILIPSIFFKGTKYSYLEDSFNGFGGDLILRISNNFSLYGGISRFDMLYGIEADVHEIGTTFKLNNLFIDFRYFARNISSPPYFTPIKDLNAFAASLNFDLWKIGLEGRFNNNSFKDNQAPVSSEIKTHFNGGIFYKDILFNGNLDLKTGFVFRYYDFESDDFESAYQLNFTAAGIIQKVAIVYFSWENLFNEQYFIVPYYPMRERGIRFGLAWEMFN